jgi:hypothetical protein
MDEMQAELLRLGESPARGYWLLAFCPEVFAERWNDIDAMRTHIREQTVNIRGPYPYPYPGCHGFQWGFTVDDPVDGGGYGFSYSGAFVHVLPFREDREGCRPCNRFPRAQTPLELSAGTWLEYQWSMFQVMEFFLFASRIFGTAPATEPFVLRAEAHGLRGRQLVTLNRSIVMPTFDPCRADEFSWTATVSAGSFLTTWKAECVRCLELFYRLFAAGEITSDILRHWIDKFETRSF